MIKSNLKTILKKTVKAIEAKDQDAKKAMDLAFKKIDKTAAKGIIHKNKAANKKSAIQILYNKVNEKKATSGANG